MITDVTPITDSPTANGGSGMMKASRNIHMKLCSMAAVIAFAAVILAICILPASAIAPTNITFGQPTTSFTIVSGHNATTPYGSLVPDIQKDDNYTKVIINDTIEDGLNINGTNYSSVYVGSNGYLTFGHGNTAYSTVGIPGYTLGPMIAAQFDDIDVSKGGDIYMYEDDLNDTVSITWKDVAPYSGPGSGTGTNTFQIRLHGLGNGDFGIEIRYENISWINGNSGNPTGGWTFGDEITYGEVNDSGTVEFLTIEDESNIGHLGVFAWEVHDGGVEEIDLNISENSPGGTVIGPLTADDDTPLQLNFSLLDDDGGNFEIFNDSGVYKVRVKSGATLDYETSPNHIRQINVQAEDPDTNTGSAWLNISLTDVNEAPTVPGAFTLPTSGQTVKGGDSMTVSWGASTDPDGDAVKYDLWYFNGTWAQIGNLLGSASTTYTLPADDTSSAMFRVYGNDTALNSSARDVTFIVDTTAPTIPTIDVPTDGSTLTSANIWVNGTMSADTANVTVYVNGSITNDSVAVSGNTYNISNVPLGADGVHEINVSAKDAAGNVNNTNATVTVIVDTTPPIVTINSPRNMSYNVTSISLNWTSTETGPGFYSQDGGVNVSLSNFTSTTINTSADGAWSVYAIDVDSDGDVDILSASKDDNKIVWYENDGSESFTAHTITTSADGAYSVYAIDVDSDGDVDVLSASIRDDKIAWYENDGSESFTAHIINTSVDGACSVYATDVDSDGDIDVLSASYLDDTIAWYENDGSESFTAHTITTSADYAYSVYAIDVDSDGDVDVLSAPYSDSQIVWYENDGSESFTAHIISSVNSPYSVYATDVDSDGDVDVLSASVLDDKIAWYENDGSQTFTGHTITTNADGAHSVYAIDVDSDGDVDILSASKDDDKIAWYENDGSQTFTTHNITTSADGAQSVYAIDIDSDGDIDVLSASEYDDKIAWYEHRQINETLIFSEGAHSVTVYAEDKAGNLNSSTVLFMVDTTLPTAPTIDMPTNGSTLASAYTWVNGTTDTDTTNVTVYVNGLITNASVAVSGTNFNISNVPLGTDGDYEINVSAIDAAWNINTTNATAIVTVDITSPTLTISSPTEDHNYNTCNISLNVTADETIDTWLYNINGTGNVTFSSNESISNLPDGNHNITVFANDSVGNIGSSMVNFTIDTTDPVIHNVSLSDTSPSYNQLIVVTVNVTDTNIANVTAGSTSLTHQLGMLWNGTITAGYGANTVTVTAYDNASNSATDSISYTGPAAPTSSGGSSGGVGVGTSDEPENVEETVFLRIYLGAGGSSTYNFNNVVTSVEVTPDRTYGLVAAKIEVLFGQPGSITSDMPAGVIYKYVNIFVGTSGWSEGKFSSSVINFQVPASWFEENNIDPATITLYRYHDGEWQPLGTTLTGQAGGYYQYSSPTPGFSTFMILGQVEDSGTIEPVATADSGTVAESTHAPEATSTKGTPGFGILLGIMGILVAVYSRRK